MTRAKPPEPRNDQQRFIDEYRRYLLHERSLVETSLLNYVPFAEQLLADRFGLSEMNLSELTATDVTKFLQVRARQLSSGRAKLLVTALRSFLRYLRHQGEISVNLAECVPPVAAWSLRPCRSSCLLVQCNGSSISARVTLRMESGTTPFFCC